MPCKAHKGHSDVSCPECKKSEKLSAALDRLRNVIVKAAEKEPGSDAGTPAPEAPDKPKLESGPSVSASMGGTSLSPGIPNPLAKR